MTPAEARARVLEGLALAGGSATVPITNGMIQAGAQLFQPLTSPAAESPPAGVSTGASGHATNYHVGGIILGFGALILALHLMGFRLAFDVGLGRG